MSSQEKCPINNHTIATKQQSKRHEERDIHSKGGKYAV